MGITVGKKVDMPPVGLIHYVETGIGDIALVINRTKFPHPRVYIQIIFGPRGPNVIRSSKRIG